MRERKRGRQREREREQERGGGGGGERREREDQMESETEESAQALVGCKDEETDETHESDIGAGRAVANDEISGLFRGLRVHWCAKIARSGQV